MHHKPKHIPLWLILVIALIGIFVLASDGWAANTGEISPSGPSTSNEVIAITNWTNTGTTPDSVSASDDQYCVYTGGSADTIYSINFSMGVTAGATVDSIFVTLEAQGSATQAARRRMVYFLVKNGKDPVGEISANNNFPQGSDGTQRMTGGTTPLWNTTWTAAEVNSANFGIAAWKTASQAGDVSLDHVTIYVAFTEVGDGVSGRRRRISQQRVEF